MRERTLLAVVLTPQGRPVAPGALQRGGAPLDPSALAVTPRSLQQVGRAPAPAPAAASQLQQQVPAALAFLEGAAAAAEAVPPAVLRPVQSFELRGLEDVGPCVQRDAPLLTLRRLPGVVRRDRAERLSVKDALAWAGLGPVLAERLLPELAYKIARAPKYGA